MDGLKLPGNASKRWSGTLSDIRKKQEKIEQKVKGLLEEQISRDKEDHDSFIDPLSRQKQIDKLRKQAERIERWLEENDAKIGSNGRELQSNVTDNESAKMMTSHGTIQGYNAQALVDKEHQVRGISDGSGICYDKILFINSLTTVARRNGCFAFAYRDRNSSIHVVRQIDIALKQELWKKMILFVVKPLDGKMFAAILNPGWIDGETGMNDKGLYISQNSINLGQSNWKIMPITHLMRYMLQYADTINDVDKILSEQDAFPVKLLFVASKESAAVFEIANDEKAKIDMENSFLALSNHSKLLPSRKIRIYIP